MAALPAAPLLAWPEIGEASRLRAERADLLSQIAEHKPHSHRAVVLKARLRDVTNRLIEVETKLAAGAARHGIKL